MGRSVGGPGTESKFLISIMGLLSLHLTMKLLKAKFSVTSWRPCAQHYWGPALTKAPIDFFRASMETCFTLGFGCLSPCLVPHWTERPQEQRWSLFLNWFCALRTVGWCSRLHTAEPWRQRGTTALGQLWALGTYYRNLCCSVACALEWGRQATTWTVVIDTL